MEPWFRGQRFCAGGLYVETIPHPSLLTYHVQENDGLFKAFVASTGDERAIGGTRWQNGTPRDKAFTTVSELALAMADKARAMELPLGGIKAFVYEGAKTRDALLRWGDFVRHVGQGRFLTSVDMGTNAGDMNIVAERAPGLVTTADPSPSTARGVGLSILAWAQDEGIELSNLRVYITGIYGQVGFALAAMLIHLGVTVYGKDIADNPVKREHLEQHGVSFVESDVFPHVDVYAPCAIGGILTRDVVSVLKKVDVRAVIGSANCQIAGDGVTALQVALDLLEAGIFYAVDYVVNGGGLIMAAENLGVISSNEAVRLIGRIPEKVLGIGALSRRKGIPTTTAAQFYFGLAKDVQFQLFYEEKKVSFSP